MNDDEPSLVAIEDAPLLVLAAQITNAHEDACRAAQSAIAHARRAGNLLIEAKAGLEHGSWLSWLGEHCSAIPERTAQAYMRVARDWPTLEAKAQRVADLPLRDALALLAEPREAEPAVDMEEVDSWERACRPVVELIELLEVARTAIADAEQDFNTLVDTHGMNATEDVELMRVVMTKLLDIEAKVSRIRGGPKPTRLQFVPDETEIRAKLCELDAALGAALQEAREVLEPTERIRQGWKGVRLLKQASALMRKVGEMTTGDLFDARKDIESILTHGTVQ